MYTQNTFANIYIAA